MAGPDWSHLLAQLGAHRAADGKEARDVAFIRDFLARHPDDAHLQSQPEGHLTGSGFVLDAGRSKVLLLHHGKLGRWLQPGGHGEGESTRARSRSGRWRETGLGRGELTPVPDHGILDVDVHRIPARAGEPAHAHLDLRYGFVARVGAAPRMSAESRELRWFPAGAPPEGCDDALRRALLKLCNAATNR